MSASFKYWSNTNTSKI